MRFLVPSILIILSVIAFIVFIDPTYKDIKDLKNEAAAYNQALDNAKSLQETRDQLSQKYNSFNPEDISKIEKLLPDSVDNIRLIIEIEKIAAQYGMILKQVKYDTFESDATNPGAPGTETRGEALLASRDYGEFELQFSTEGEYSRFLSFLADLESSLRIVDITNVTFSSESGVTTTGLASGSYKYDFTVKTYWLKN